MWWRFIKPVHAQVHINQHFPPAQAFPQVGDLVNVLLANALTVAGVIAFLGVIISGFRFLQHAGNMEGEAAAKDKMALTAFIIGLVLIFGAFFIVQIVQYIVGFDFLIPKI